MQVNFATYRISKLIPNGKLVSTKVTNYLCQCIIYTINPFSVINFQSEDIYDEKKKKTFKILGFRFRQNNINRHYI